MLHLSQRKGPPHHPDNGWTGSYTDLKVVYLLALFERPIFFLICVKTLLTNITAIFTCSRLCKWQKQNITCISFHTATPAYEYYVPGLITSVQNVFDATEWTCHGPKIIWCAPFFYLYLISSNSLWNVKTVVKKRNALAKSQSFPDQQRTVKQTTNGPMGLRGIVLALFKYKFTCFRYLSLLVRAEAGA